LTGIQVTPEYLSDASRNLTTGAQTIDDTLATLRGQIAPLAESWQGAAQAQFQSLWVEWENSAKGLHAALTGIATLTQQASNAYAQTEQAIKSSFAS